MPVGVEAVNGFVSFARDMLGEGEQLERVLLKLADSVHPMVLGNAYRARLQIRMLGERLLRNHMSNDRTIQRILDFLCSDSGSHDYTINVEVPSDRLYKLIKDVYDDVVADLDLRNPFDPSILVAGGSSSAYSVPRALIESVEGGSHVYVSEGALALQQVQGPQGVVQQLLEDRRTFEGWRHSHE